MSAINKGGVLAAEHDLLRDAFDNEFLGLDNNDARSGLQYVMGVHDMASRIIDILDGKVQSNE